MKFILFCFKFSIMVASGRRRRNRLLMKVLQARIGALALAVSLLMFACSSAKPTRSQKALQPSVAGTNSSIGGGPTLRLDYGKTDAPANPISVFMYFVPLISPEPVSITENPGNTQSAKV